MKRWLRSGLGPIRVPFRLRFFFRAIFLLLALAVLALALSVLQDEKQRSHRAYADTLARNQAQIAARLRHPTGQLALLNARYGEPVPGRPLLLPWSAIDLDSRDKAQQAAETAGCGWQYPNGATLCLALGSNPQAGAFVYVVGTFAAPALVAHEPGRIEVDGVSRVRFDVAHGERRESVLALYQLASDGRGRLAGFDGRTPIAHGTKALRDFRGWLWQDARCIDDSAPPDTCTRRSFLSARVPADVLREALATRPTLWPPADLDRLNLTVTLLAPDGGAVFDSAAPGAQLPFALSDLRALLLPGETLAVRRDGDARDLVNLSGRGDEPGAVSPWIAQLIRRLPVEGFDAPLQARETIATPLGRYTLTLTGDIRGVNAALAAVATRLMGYVAAILAAIVLAWLAIELAIVRRITLLTQRAAAVSSSVRGSSALTDLDLSDLRGSDELGVLAQGLKDLLARVNEDTRRERIRTEQERDQWHAVGHEIVAPLQSLKALHASPDDPSSRYIDRMLTAVRVLYGQASPSEAIEARAVDLGTLDLDAFLSQAAANAHFIGIDGVVYRGGTPCTVRADEYSLEDVVTHVLRNAQRHRTPGTPIEIGLDAAAAGVTIRNQGPRIPEGLLERIFEYGVSGEAQGDGQRGQGLFVARTYMAKMGGTITARNDAGGVTFLLTLPRAG